MSRLNFRLVMLMETVQVQQMRVSPLLRWFVYD